MRRTLHLDEDVARQLAALSRAGGRSHSPVANDLRAGLQSRQAPPGQAAYEPDVLDTGAPAVDGTDVVQALEGLDRRGG